VGASLQISIPIGESIATGRAIAAARVLLGLDQVSLAASANVSTATISNVERGHGVRAETLHAILAAVRRRGATVTIDRTGYASIAINFHEPATMPNGLEPGGMRRLNTEPRSLLGFMRGMRRQA
jgi:transcriptional regulator with XRE-family HTH domain